MSKAKTAGISIGISTVILGLIIGAVVYVVVFRGASRSPSTTPEEQADEIYKAARIPEVDKYLLENAEALGDDDRVEEVLDRAVKLAKEHSDDPGLIELYAKYCERITDMSIESLLGQKRKVIEGLQKAPPQTDGEANTRLLRELSILEAFEDAAEKHALPNIKKPPTKTPPTPKDEKRKEKPDIRDDDMVVEKPKKSDL